MTVGRLKSHTAGTGFVWEYYFAGKSHTSDGAAAEFVFQVTRDRTSFRPIRVFVQSVALESWRAAAGRELAAPEQFAAAKLRLIALLDQERDPAADSAVYVTPENIFELLEPLDLL